MSTRKTSLLNLRWEPHYTGIETVELRAAPFSLYLQRDRESKRLQFVRLSNAYAWRRFRPGFMFGAHIGRTNYGGRGKGFELFTCGISAGYLSDAKDSLWGVRWSGSSIDPHHSYILHFGRVFIASRCDAWLKRIVARRAARAVERAESAWFASLSPAQRAEIEAEDAHYAAMEREQQQ